MTTLRIVQESSNSVTTMGVYLHGKLEEDFGYDIFATNMVLLEGTHIATYKGKFCIIFVWVDTTRPVAHRMRGFAVYADDNEAMAYAIKLAKNQASNF